MNKKSVLLLIRAGCLALVGLSLKSAWAGIPFQQGMEYFGRQEYRKALTFAERGLAFAPHQPEYLDLAGRSAFYAEDFSPAEKYFNALLQTAPRFPRAKLYFAECRLRLEAKKSGKISEEQWKEIRTLHEEASANEPSSPWNDYMIASQVLKFSPRLDASEIDASILRLQAAAIAAPERYLVPSYELVWNKTSDFSQLEKITPDTLWAYSRFVEFIKKKNLWPGAGEVFLHYFTLKQKDYGKYCQAGKAFFKAGSAARAFTEYEKAYWINPQGEEAKKGLINASLESGRALPEPLKKEMAAQAQEKERNPVRDYPAIWWKDRGKELSISHKKTGMTLHLRPGKTKILIQAISFPDKQGMEGFILARLGGVPLGAAYLKGPEMQTLSYETETNGGANWLEIELLNAAAGGPVVAPGDVRAE